MAWSPQQDAALRAVSAWIKRGEPQVFRLFGYAGTGKTTLAKQLAADIDGDVAFAAFTGKAALVLRAKGCKDARTIHSTIYRLRDADTEEPTFVLNDDAAAAKAELIIIDECSMVDEDLGRDLLSFGKPVLVLGDPAQLPPVKGGGFFTDAEPDIMLTEVHRQAADNPIVRLSMMVRDGERIPQGIYGASRVMRRSEIDAGLVQGADQVLVGLNRTRRGFNARMRQLAGHTDPYPQPGEKLVCLKNEKTKGLLNGGIWIVKTAAAKRAGKLRYGVVPDDDQTRKPLRIAVRPEYFTDGEEAIPPSMRRSTDAFDYGYVLTVHKAQGSQWDHVVLFDESGAFRENRNRWLYTGITRAAETLTIVV
jgi:exodeoxyribonuclease-5